MYFGKFSKKISEQVFGSEIKSQIQLHGHLVEETVDGAILIDRELTCFLSLDEVRQSIKYGKIKEDIEEEIHKELYENISHTKIADIIHNHHDVKVTDTLIESYVELASSKIFTLDPVVSTIREYNTVDRLIESKLDFKLDDGTAIVISEDTYNRINNIFADHADVVAYMRQSAENFLSVVDQLED